MEGNDDDQANYDEAFNKQLAEQQQRAVAQPNDEQIDEVPTVQSFMEKELTEIDSALTPLYITQWAKTNYDKKRIGYGMQTCLALYHSKFPRMFEQYYKFFSIQCEQSISDFPSLSKDFEDVIKGEDIVGCLNYYKSKLYGMVLMTNRAYEKLNSFVQGYLGGIIRLEDIHDEADRRMTETWGRGEKYFIY